jgi:hypothetical protein
VCTPGAAAKNQLRNAHKQFGHNCTFFLTTSPHHISRLPDPCHILTVALPCQSGILQVLRSNASLEPDWRCSAHSRNAAFESPPANTTVQEAENAFPAMNETLTGTRTKPRHTAVKAPSWMLVNSDFVSNEIDESELQDEKHDEQRI